MADPAASRGQKLLPVQVLRAAAALSVAALHAQYESGLYGGATGGTFAPSRLLPWGAGVDVFFVISGFVMVYASRGLFARPGAARLFLARRVARVVPLYWLTTAAYLALALAAPRLVNGGAPTPGTIASSFLFWPMARPDGLVQPLYSLGWTLNYEMAFYGLFALAIGLSRGRAVAMVCCALVGLVAAGLFLHWPQPLAFWSEPIVLEFAAGMLLGQARSEGVRLSVAPRIALGLAALVLLATIADREAIAGVERLLLWGGPAACLVAACALGHDDPWRGAPRLERIGAAVGDASYALYLVHPFAIRGAREAVKAAGLAGTVPPGAFLLIGLALAVVAALGIHRLVERPLTRLARRALGRPDAGGG